LAALTYWRAPDAPDRDKLGRLAAIDYANYLPEYILRKADLCTMAHGLEARAPFLDHHFVQRILALPRRERYTRPPKQLLRRAVDPRLPRDLFERKKRGFNPPLRDWLRKLAPRLDGLGGRLESLTDAQLAGTRLDLFVDAYRKGEERLAEQVLQLLILDESLRQLKAAAA
jgi:asparagine synthase (glutamine-hydrolysing)